LVTAATALLLLLLFLLLPLLLVPVCDSDTLDDTVTELLDSAGPGVTNIPVPAAEDDEEEEAGGRSKLKSATMVPLTTADALTSLIESELIGWKWFWPCCC
jgi:hypothetical protein